jgi:hypothetical protein
MAGAYALPGLALTVGFLVVARRVGTWEMAACQPRIPGKAICRW